MIYLETSFLFSLYFRDLNTPSALALVAKMPAPTLITPLCELEAINAFAQRVFRKEMSAVNMANAVRDLQADIRSGVLDLRPLPEAAFVRAKTLAQTLTPKIGVRSADLLHVAAALELGAARLFGFDLRQREAAKAAGLKVNPLP
jgi:predicted nucleic acid-binding protein